MEIERKFLIQKMPSDLEGLFECKACCQSAPGG